MNNLKFPKVNELQPKRLYVDYFGMFSDQQGDEQNIRCQILLKRQCYLGQTRKVSEWLQRDYAELGEHSEKWLAKFPISKYILGNANETLIHTLHSHCWVFN